MKTRSIAQCPDTRRWPGARASLVLILATCLAGPILAACAAGPARSSVAPPAAPREAAPSGRPKEFDYTAWNAWLARYVRSGLVDYAAAKKDGAKDLDATVAAMARHPYRTVFAKEARLAFLINAHNAFAIQEAVKAFPLARPDGGPKDIPGFFDRMTHPLDGGKFTLNQIEDDLIKPISVKEPRYHLALCRAAAGAPPLRDHAYSADSLALQLENQVMRFNADNRWNFYDEKADTLYLSELFKWHRSDYEWGDQTLVRFLAPNFSLGVMMKLMQNEPPIVYRPFDWRLNDVRNAAPVHNAGPDR